MVFARADGESTTHPEYSSNFIFLHFFFHLVANIQQQGETPRDKLMCYTCANNVGNV